MHIPITFWVVNEALSGHLWFRFMLVILALLQTGSVCHLIWFLVSKFYLSESYTQDIQEDMMPTSEEGTCGPMFSETFLSLLVSTFAAAELWFTLTVHHETRASEYSSPLKGAKMYQIWFHPSFPRMRVVSQQKCGIYFRKQNWSTSL